MAVAAVPAYLGRDFSKASPGLRFGMYLPLWGIDRRTGEINWETRDQKYEVRGQDHVERRIPHENKGDALRQALSLTADDVRCVDALRGRQSALALSPGIAQSVLTLDARSVAPFATGLGNEHPLENGFAFLNPYGLPYLPGSGVKGVLRQAARELASGEWGDPRGWTEAAIARLFGLESKDGDKTHQRGALSFWDVLPQLEGGALQRDVMTPHQSHYYQRRKGEPVVPPHDSGQPNPIHFLTVPPGSRFTFHVQCDLPFLQRLAAPLAEEGRWQALLQAAFEHAFAWLGFGAKTAVGYGAMTEDEQAATERQRELQKKREEEARRQAQAERAHAISEMAPADRAMAELFDKRADKNQTERSVLFNALKSGQLAEYRVEAARRVEALMRSEGRWRDKSEKKNPDKDQPFQETLAVKKWLGA